jgi:hypothetical protein
MFDRPDLAGRHVIRSNVSHPVDTVRVRDRRGDSPMHERVHHTQARKAFRPGGGSYAARLVSAVDRDALVARLSDHVRVALVVARPDRLAAVLRRADVSLIETAPLVLVSESYGVLGVATGPAEPPSQLRVWSNISLLEDGEAVEIPAVDPEQPSLQLLAARRAA